MTPLSVECHYRRTQNNGEIITQYSTNCRAEPQDGQGHKRREGEGGRVEGMGWDGKGREREGGDKDD